MTIEFKGKGAPTYALSSNILSVKYASPADYGERASADDALIRKAAKVLSAEIPARVDPTDPHVVHYTLAS